MKISKLVIFLTLNVCSLTLFSCKENNLVQSNEFRLVGETNQVAEPTPSTDFSIPDGWFLFPNPKPNSVERQCANYSIKREWKVETDNGNLKISKYAYDASEQIKNLPPNLQKVVSKNRNIGKGLGGYLHVEPFENGWLIGSDAGEWGGKLFWFDADGNQKIELLRDNIRGIVEINGEAFILSGMAHGDIDEGKIYKLTKDQKGNLKTQLLIDLKTQPQTFVIENNQSVLIALKDKIVRLKSSGEIENLKETNFSSLYSNSMMITSSKVIYVGMRLFVVRFIPGENGYTEEWLVPQNCQKFIEKEFDCVCQKEK